MIREVYIDKKLIDVSTDNLAGYIFTSPVFRDITRILSNRTTTYKIPKTVHNLEIFGLIDNPDVQSDFPYREHTFEEYRDGLLFIKGICTLIKCADSDLELSVIWGNTINLLKLKDLKLRELKSDAFVTWNKDSKFLPSNSTDDFGFVALDFGRGLADMKYIHPSVTVKGILKMIERSEGVRFDYPERFEDVFTKKWIPLLEKNANEKTWEEYKATAQFSHFASEFSDTMYFHIKPAVGGWDPKKIISSNGFVKWTSDGYTVHSTASMRMRNEFVRDGWKMRLKWNIIQDLGVYGVRIGELIASEEVFVNEDGWFYFSLEGETEIQNEPKEFAYSFEFVSEEGEIKTPQSPVIERTIIHITVKNKEAVFGDKLPIAPNLPDMTCVEFLKTIMQMYGLFTYYDYKLDDSTIRFISIDDIYKYKEHPYNWTDKLINTTSGRFNLTYTYGDYAQKNNFKFKNDESVLIDANGFLAIDNQTIALEKDISSIDFSPSNNTTDEDANSYARIELYDKDGKMGNVKNRILSRGKPYEVKENEEDSYYMTAIFDNELSFGHPQDGLLAKYYKAYQAVLRRPVVVECYVYLSDLELHQYREITPVYIDGTFYMPIEVTVQTDSLAVCQLIRMPYLDPDLL